MKAQHPTEIRLAAYADGELKRGERREIERHLERCAQCQAELAGLRALSVRLREFALPEGVGRDLWQRVQQRLPERRTEMQPAPGGFLRWLLPVGLVASNVVLQAALIVALGLWALDSLGILDWRTLATAWLPAGVQLPHLSPDEAIAHLLSWLVAAPLGPGFSALTQVWGVDVSPLFSWLMPGALAVIASVGLALLYLSWLLAYWRSQTHAASPDALRLSRKGASQWIT
ncbi:MAG: zf-HC2 domain-containing protein [Anaerolineae bacterium]|nr:zf-HC2 domain-containing protein [Anaerolineae bacterium]